MKKTFGSIFSGFGAVDVAAKTLGYELVTAVEYEPKLAEVYRANHGDHVTVADVRDVDWKALEAPDVLWGSPVCTRASQANVGAMESELDKDCARAFTGAFTCWRPDTVYMENVYQYRNFESFGIICDGLTRAGYVWDFWHLNSANFGVPQTRWRLILIARRGGDAVPRPRGPVKTHAECPGSQGVLFGDVLLPWNGWYAAIEDILDTLPESQFAPWQMARLEGLGLTETFLHMTCNTQMTNPTGTGVCCVADPSNTVVSTSSMVPRAFIIPGGNAGSEAFPLRMAHEPAVTVTHGQTPRALLMGDQYRSECLDHQPAMTVTANANDGAAPRALIACGTSNDRGESMTVRDEAEPMFTVTKSTGGRQAARALVSEQGDWLKGGRVVAMTPRALARFQSFPDSYQLTGNRKLDCIGIGNAVPCGLTEAVIRSTQ